MTREFHPIQATSATDAVQTQNTAINHVTAAIINIPEMVIRDAKQAIDGRYGNGSVLNMAEWILELVRATLVVHSSDCALHNEPALPKGKCDCVVADFKVLLEAAQKARNYIREDLLECGYEDSDISDHHILIALDEALAAKPQRGDNTLPSADDLQKRIVYLENTLREIADGMSDMKHNAADSVSGIWLNDSKGTAGWSNKSIMAWAYRDLRGKLTALANNQTGE